MEALLANAPILLTYPVRRSRAGSQDHGQCMRSYHIAMQGVRRPGCCDTASVDRKATRSTSVRPPATVGRLLFITASHKVNSQRRGLSKLSARTIDTYVATPSNIF